MSSKFAIGDPVRVTNPKLDHFDRTGVVTEYHEIACEAASMVHLHGMDYPLGFKQSSLTLADPERTDEPDPVSSPSHYTSHPSGVEAITITRHESFLRGNVLKYVLRAPYKGSELQDLRKAAQYLQWEIERAEAAL